MSYINIHVDDFGWQARLRVVQDGTPLDISTYTTRQFVFRAPNGIETSKTAAFLTDGTDGWLVYTVEDGLINRAASSGWRVWAHLEKTGVELTSAAVEFAVNQRGD